jgi:hypothetical protein
MPVSWWHGKVAEPHKFLLVLTSVQPIQSLRKFLDVLLSILACLTLSLKQSIAVQ